MSQQTTNYNRAKLWQIGLFAFNNTATNVAMALMGYLAFFSQNILGVMAAVIGVILTSMRIFDGITDPIIGLFIDKTEGKFGKFRPFMFVGNIIIISCMYLIFAFVPTLDQGVRLPALIGIYVIYIFGYTFQTACTKAAQSVLTNDPKQRPIFAIFDGIYNTILFAAAGLVITSILPPKFELGMLDPGLWKQVALMFGALSFGLTILAIIGIWEKDREEFFGLGEKGTKTKFSDYVSVLKGNRAIQMLIVSAATDKLALTAAGNASVMVMLYGIVMGNYQLYGKMSLITTIPTFIIILLGTKFASKFGSKKALVVTTWLSILGYLALFLVIFLGDPSKISLENFGIMTALWIGVFCFANGVKSVSSSIVIPMIADCADYETYLTGRYVPGMMGTLFSFVDKMISSFATTVVGLVVATIGYTATMPQATDAYTTELFWATAFLFVGLPIIGWVCSLIAMKFYPLDDKKMAEVQEKLAEIRSEGNIA